MVTETLARELTVRFLEIYPGARRELAFRFRQTAKELYKNCPSEMEGVMLGGYSEKPLSDAAGRTYRGRVDMVLANISDSREFLRTLNHEVIGHYGLNTLHPSDRKGIIDAIIKARNGHSIGELWAKADRLYSGKSLEIRAEEIFAFTCEDLHWSQHVGNGIAVTEQGWDSFGQTCDPDREAKRPIEPRDLANIARMIAQGIHDQSRRQRTFLTGGAIAGAEQGAKNPPSLEHESVKEAEANPPPELVQSLFENSNRILPEIREISHFSIRGEDENTFPRILSGTLIALLKTGDAPWLREAPVLPVNPASGKRYKGINGIALMSQGRGDPRWLTQRQAEWSGAQVRRGEKGTQVQYWRFTDADGNGLERPQLINALVFNAEQIDGIIPDIPALRTGTDPATRAEHIIKASQAYIEHLGGAQAHYRPDEDKIVLPPPDQPALDAQAGARADILRLVPLEGTLEGTSVLARIRARAAEDPRYHAAVLSLMPSLIERNGEKERATLKSVLERTELEQYLIGSLHELCHWTGHPSRLKRDLNHPFGSDGYAAEELRACIASMLLSAELNIPHNLGRHDAYAPAWARLLEHNPLEVFRAARDAEKIASTVMAYERAQILPPPKRTPTPTLAQMTEAEYLAVRAAADAFKQELERAYGKETAGEARYYPQHTDPAAQRAADAFALANAAWKGAVRVARFVLDQTRREHQEQKETDMNTREPGQKSAALDEALKRGNKKDIDRAVYAAFGTKLPDNWNGKTAVIGYANRTDGGKHKAVPAARLGVEPEYWTVVAFYTSSKNRNRNTVVAKCATQEEAESIAAKLRGIAAHLKAAKNINPAPLALIEGVPPQLLSSEEDLSASTLIDVPYRDKDRVKALGAKYSAKEKTWYLPEGTDTAPFAEWLREQRRYLAVPYSERIEAKAAGARYDKAMKLWYVPPKANMAAFARWEKGKPELPRMSPEEEFAEFLRGMGLRIEGEHPIMDGRHHRVPVEGAKKGTQDGSYIGFLDSHPAGQGNNFKSGEKKNWKAKGYSLTPQKAAAMYAKAAELRIERDEERSRTHAATAARLEKQLSELVPLTAPTPYLQSKGIAAMQGIFTDSQGLVTFVPAYDTAGNHWTTQYIQPDGTKRFASNSRKKGCFHPIGGFDALDKAPVLVIAEGYATGATLGTTLGYSTVVAFDSGNLTHVAMALHEKYPEKPIVIAGDDDRHVQYTTGKNPGRAKAEEAARLVNGRAIFPIFAPGENDYPDGIPPVTPASYKAHLAAKQRLEEQEGASEPEADRLRENLLGEAQLEALERMRGHTDFNDLAEKSALGREGVRRQIATATTNPSGQTPPSMSERAQQYDNPLSTHPAKTMTTTNKEEYGINARAQ
jgi:phage/plasmid primase-like uncharacterized protein/antirestriction protein ArdC